MNHTRHSGIFDVSALSATVIGAGGIGAITAVALAKMGIGALYIYDADRVDEVNLATQFHALESIGMEKGLSLSREIERFSDDTALVVSSTRVDENTPLYGSLIISAVDSIASRKAIWRAVRKSRSPWYLDARMGAEEFHLFAVDMRCPEWYEQIIMGEDDSRVPDLPCTSKATFYTACTAAGHLGCAVRKIGTGVAPHRYIVHNIFHDRLIVVAE